MCSRPRVPPYFILYTQALRPASTFSGRAGRCWMRTPVASQMASMTATWDEVNGSSPTPAAPNGPIINQQRVAEKTKSISEEA